MPVPSSDSTTDDERVRLTLEEAIKRLPDGEQIHTFRSSPIALIGADWEREDLIQAMAANTVEESGPAATEMHHGMVFIDENGPLFIETRQDEAQP